MPWLQVTTWTCPAPPPVVSRASEPPSRSADEDRSRATSLASDSDIDVSSMEMSQTPEWGLFGWTVEQVKAQMLPEVVSTHAELFLINGDLQAMFYTASRAMHSQLINLLEGKRARPRSSGMGVVTNAGLAVQRRFNNLVQVGLLDHPPPAPGHPALAQY